MYESNIHLNRINYVPINLISNFGSSKHFSYQFADWDEIVDKIWININSIEKNFRTSLNHLKILFDDINFFNCNCTI